MRPTTEHAPGHRTAPAEPCLLTNRAEPTQGPCHKRQARMQVRPAPADPCHKHPSPAIRANGLCGQCRPAHSRIARPEPRYKRPCMNRTVQPTVGRSKTEPRHKRPSTHRSRPSGRPPDVPLDPNSATCACTRIGPIRRSVAQAEPVPGLSRAASTQQTPIGTIHRTLSKPAESDAARTAPPVRRGRAG